MSNSWIALFQKVHQQYIPQLPFDGNVLYGRALAYTFVDALQRAGANPTRQSIVDTIETQKLNGPVSYRSGTARTRTRATRASGSPRSRTARRSRWASR